MRLLGRILLNYSFTWEWVNRSLFSGETLAFSIAVRTESTAASPITCISKRNPMPVASFTREFSSSYHTTFQCLGKHQFNIIGAWLLFLIKTKVSSRSSVYSRVENINIYNLICHWSKCFTKSNSLFDLNRSFLLVGMKPNGFCWDGRWRQWSFWHIHCILSIFVKIWPLFMTVHWMFFRKFSKFACKYFSNLNYLLSCAIFSEFSFQVS